MSGRIVLPDLSSKLIDDDRIQLLEPLGAGAYGAVYSGLNCLEDATSPSYFAVKIMPREDKTSHGGALQSREINYHGYVSGHPNILKLYRVAHDSEYTYIIMDYCPGGDMYRIVSLKHTFARNDVLIKSLFLQLVDAVDACHQNGIFHRDLKPENVLVSDDSTRLFLADFGLATKSERSTSFGVGSSTYMSPECINYYGDNPFYEPRINDIWALGVILINMITGRSPWKQAMPSDECFYRFMQDSSVLRRMLPLSQAVDDVLQRIFLPLPEDRIDLFTLRQLILEVDTFYMSEEELIIATPPARHAWETYQSYSTDLDPFACDSTSSIMQTASEGLSSSSSEEAAPDESQHEMCSDPLCRLEQKYVSARVFKRVLEASDFRGIFTLGSAEEDSFSDSNRSQSPADELYPHVPSMPSSSSFYSVESSSAEESDGPRTPETHAQNPAIAVPDLNESMGIERVPKRVESVAAKPNSRTRWLKRRLGIIQSTTVW
ncbi:uncharacterized protein FIBRA_02848 [Fibroporia radiculosa]|uniref:Protein kinase domain-containing protein n=1 Tax=Fibroporia radiculosa TaxID=599839 RepID=J4I9A2_9APHY|nr:uncharacterized protein FIBRA_02848 [Fibroporia radiculosa]CCM00806.1 predicted protein [Fibroporia radiculosa]